METFLTLLLLKRIESGIAAQLLFEFMESYSILSFQLPSQTDFGICEDESQKQN